MEIFLLHGNRGHLMSKSCFILECPMQLPNTSTRWQEFDSMHALQVAVCDAIVELANHAILKKGRFDFVLAGGNTPTGVYKMLCDKQTDWSKWHLYHGDERCLPTDHPERNSLMVQEALLDKVAIPIDQSHPIPAELGPINGASAYVKTLHGLGCFDLVLLGLGEDGHTASLFPGHAVDNSADAVPVFGSPKPPSERISLSQNRLSHAEHVIFMVSGAGKQQAVNDWRSGLAIPATLIQPANGVEVYAYDVSLA
jgi:6-phosphogluconolactonase